MHRFTTASLALAAAGTLSVAIASAEPEPARPAPASTDAAVDPAPTTTKALEGEASNVVPYDRWISSVGFAPGSGGTTNVVVEYGYRVGANPPSSLLAEVVVEIVVGGTTTASSMFPGQFDFISNDAILCAVQCASGCGSIFGDGICAGCDCDYGRTATLPFASIPQGATVRASLLVLGAPELDTSNDELEVVFGAPTEPCEEDIDGDGIVGIGDLLRLLGAWGPCP